MTAVSTIPLTDMKLLSGTRYDPEANAIIFDGSRAGFAVYGPYFSAPAGRYTVSFDIDFPIDGDARVTVDLFSGGQVLAVREIFCTGTDYQISGIADLPVSIEFRVTSEHIPFVLRRLRIENRTDQAGDEGEYASRFRAHLDRLVANAIPGKDIKAFDDSDIYTSLLQSNSIRQIPHRLINAERDFLARRGIDANLAETLMRSPGLTEESDTQIFPAGFPPIDNSYQARIVRDRGFRVRSPISGEWIEASGSIPVSGRHGLIGVIYEFLDEAPILIGCGAGWAGAVSFVWFVREGIVVYNDDYWSQWTSVTHTLNRYLQICRRNPTALERYRASEKRIGIFAGFLDNLGHYFWNDVSGIDRLIRAGLQSSVDVVFQDSNSRWLKPDAVFSEEFKGKFQSLESADDMLQMVLKEQILIVRPTATSIDQVMATRVQQSALQNFEISHHERFKNYYDQSRSENFILFINLRAHNKIWIEQKLGFSRIIQYFLAIWGDRLVVVFDGFSDCREEIEAIARGIPELRYWVDATSCDLSETLAWMFRADFFVATVGSALALLTWTANRPGICHGDTRHMMQKEFWDKVRTEPLKVFWVPDSAISDVSNMFYSDYHLDPTEMLRFIESFPWPIRQPD